MKKERKHESLTEKFWHWWEYSSFSDVGFAVFLLVLVLLMLGLLVSLLVVVFRPDADKKELSPDQPMDGVGRVVAEESPVHLAYGCPDEIETAHRIETYTEWIGTAPAWYRPWEPMAAEWEAPQRRDAGCPDWNADTTSWGWDGHGAEAWELDLLGRIFYLEFWQPDMVLCEAGCDAILRLWESGEKGRTLGEVLSSRNEDGSWTYSTYPEVWTTDYDAEGLAWCRDYTAERFYNGPEWIAPYFRLDYYHDWAVPAYQIGNVYFSVGG